MTSTAPPRAAAGVSMKERVSRLPMEAQQEFLATLPVSVLQEIIRDEWWWTSRPEQVPPPGDWLIYLVLSGRGWGKALPLDTPIPTPGGWTTMGDLRPGDRVFSADGSVTPVSWVSPVQLGNTCHRVVFSDGTSIVADADHQWVARSRGDRRARRGYRTVTTAQMISGGLRCPGERQWQMPAAATLRTPDIDLPLDPYVLGFWLGDGASAGSDFTIGDRDAPQVLQIFADAGVPLRRCASGNMRYRPPAVALSRDGLTGRLRPNGSLTSVLRSMGLLGNKQIPADYLRAGTDQRLSLLAGLIDSDGYVEHATGRVEITTIRLLLAEQVAELARTLGHKARIINGDSTLNGVVIGPKYRVVWVARGGGGRLPRKRLADRSRLGQPDRIVTRYVDRIEPVVSVPVRCIGVAHPSETFLAGRNFLVTHNSRSGSEWIVDRTLKHPVDTSGAPTERLIIAETIADARKICVGGPSGVLRVLQRRGVRYRYIKSPKPQIEFLDTGCLIHIEGADNSDVGRGHNAADVWLDEMAKWPDPRGSWIEGIMPALRVDVPGDHPRAFITTTPKPIALLREWSTRDDGTVLTVRGSTFDNKINLSSLILETLASTYKGTQIGLQELEGVLLDAAVGKVFSQVDINTARVTDNEVPDLRMVVVGVDPGGTGEEDETGIVVVGRDLKYDQYVLGDHTILGVGREAARHCWRIVAQYDANKLIVENTLGKAWVTEAFTDAYKEMCEEGLFPSGSRPPLALIDSKQSKKTRAQPVGMRCEQHRLHFVGTHSLLENQCVEFDPKDKDSPDRFDALVSASRWLMKQEPRRATVTTPTSLRNSAKDGDGGADVLRRLEQELFRW